MPVILLALTVHEFAHGWVAWRCGDPTAKNAGRLTFNPISHLDLFGTIMLFFGPFGWAKPVPVHTSNLGNPRRDIKLVSVAGPAANILLGIIFGLLYRFLVLESPQTDPNSYFVVFLQLGIYINFGLSFFNLLPVPPLDGSKIIMASLSNDTLNSYLRIVQHVPTIFLFLMVAEWMFHLRLFSFIIDPIWNPYFTLFQLLLFGRKVL
jgi:Zn-dependent protease